MSSCDCDRKHIRHEHHHDYCLCHCTCRCHSEERENRCSCACHDGGHGGEGHGGGPEPGGYGGTTVGWKNPGRPGHTCGTSTGQVPGGVLQPGNFGHTPPNRWPGPRDQLFLPFLFMRANPGDLAARPVVGPFWESPDILLLAGVEPAFAPAVPPDLGQTALAEQPNTLYAHVWNFGLAQAPNVVVEFYWCDPSLGIGPASANLIGEAMVSLGARGSGQSHALVKCPAAWTPKFRTTMLASILVFCVLFNHQSESPSYSIAMIGAAIWFAASDRRWWRTTLIVACFVVVDLASTSLLPHAIYEQYYVKYLLKTVPLIPLWIVIQCELFGLIDTTGSSERAEPNELNMVTPELHA